MEDDFDFDSDYSCYGADISSISELPDISTNVQKLRILHCPQLGSMQGIENLYNLEELNLSSNAISRIESLHNLQSLKTLNLSCNNIRVINCLSGLYSLEKLVLSFNRIPSLYNLKQLYGEEYHNFRSFDIKGNNIAQLAEIQYLSGCVYLRDVCFSASSGTNPVCSIPEYYYSVLNVLPALQFLDQKPVNAPPATSPVKKEPQPAPTQKFLSEEEDSLFYQYRSEILRLQQENERLYGQFREVTYKLDSSDHYWNHRIHVLETEASESAAEAKEYDKENRRLIRELNIKDAKISVLEEDLKGNSSKKDQKEKMIEDMHNRMTLIMNDLSDAQKTAQLAIDEGNKKQEKMRLLEKQNTDLKQELKYAESTLNQIHARALDSSSAALSKYEEVTRKYEAAAQSLEDKEKELTALHKKNTKLLELNEKFDENWAAKFREAIAHKDTIINNLTVELSNSLAQAKEKNTQIMYTEKQEMMNTLWKLKQEAADKDNEFKEILRETTAEISVKKKEIYDLQEMLRMSVQKEKSAKDLIMELTELVKQVKGQIDAERETHSQEICMYKEKEAKLQHDFTNIESKYKTTKSRLEECDKELNSGENLIYEKNKQNNKLKREIENATEQLEETFNTIKTYKTKLHKSEEYFNNEICSLKSTVQDLELSIGTKNAIINDQNENISELKHTAKQYEDEIRNIEGYKSQYKENYEDKLQVAYDDIEKLRKKLKTSEEVTRKLEEQLDDYEEDKKEYKQTITKYETQLQEKLELIEAIEKEVRALQEEHEQKLENIIDEKDKIISDLKLFRDELNASLIVKGNECKYQTKITGELETELDSMKRQLNGSQEKSREMQDEIRVLLLEITNQKRQASETIAQLTKIFS